MDLAFGDGGGRGSNQGEPLEKGAPAAERSPRSLVLTVMGINISVILGLQLCLRCL